jgi:hypothetical protein
LIAIACRWRSDRREWVIKNGCMQWFLEDVRLGRVFFPPATSARVP